MSESFGFRVTAPREPGTLSQWDRGAQWGVHLPHQCDEWEIVYDDPQDKAVATLEAFIAEAQQALEALRRGEEYGEDEPNPHDPTPTTVPTDAYHLFEADAEGKCVGCGAPTVARHDPFRRLIR